MPFPFTSPEGSSTHAELVALVYVRLPKERHVLRFALGTVDAEGTFHGNQLIPAPVTSEEWALARELTARVAAEEPESVAALNAAIAPLLTAHYENNQRPRALREGGANLLLRQPRANRPS